jgi:hypothetical protein
MTGAIANEFRLAVPHGKLTTCIERLEEGLRALRETLYHAILGRDYLHHAEEAAEYIVDFFREAREAAPVAALYFEMNGFSINPGRWYFEGFAYERGDTLWNLTWDTEWLSRWDKHTRSQFTLTGWEPVQDAFARLYAKPKQPLGVQLAGEIAEYLVVARYDQLIGAAHAIAKKKCRDLTGVPVLCTAHEWDTLYPLE